MSTGEHIQASDLGLAHGGVVHLQHVDLLGRRGPVLVQPDDRLLAGVDASLGAAPLKGSVLVARSGKGAFVYTGLSFFRQLPAGVPGAFRLFANLVDASG